MKHFVPRTLVALCLAMSPALLAGCPATGPTQTSSSDGETAQAGYTFVSGTLSAEAVINTGGGNIIAPGGGNYRTVLQAGGKKLASGKVKMSSPGCTKEAEIGADGKWKLQVKMGFTYTLEGTAVDASGKTYKSVSTFEVPLAQDPQVMDAGSLVTRRTGTIQGVIALKDAKPGETPEGADVFISGGTSLVGKANDKGRFTLTALPEGTWNVIVQKPGYKTASVKAIQVKAGQPQMLPETITLERDGGQPSGVKGAITDGAGAAVLGATVTAYPKDRTAAGFDNFVATTNARGEYELLNLPPGDYTLQVYRPFYELLPPQDVTVAAGGVQELPPVRLQSSELYFGQATGQVVDEEGNPIDGAIAQTEPQVADQQFSDAAGHFTLDRVMAGTYTLHVSAGGYEPYAVDLSIPNTKDARIDLGSIVLRQFGMATGPLPEPVTPPADKANMIVNGDFSQGASSWTPQCTTWGAYGGAPWPLSYCGDFYKASARGLTLVGTATRYDSPYISVSQTVTTSPDVVLTGTVDVESIGSCNNAVFVKATLLDSAQKPLGGINYFTYGDCNPYTNSPTAYFQRHESWKQGAGPQPFTMDVGDLVAKHLTGVQASNVAAVTFTLLVYSDSYRPVATFGNLQLTKK